MRFSLRALPHTLRSTRGNESNESNEATKAATAGDEFAPKRNNNEDRPRPPETTTLEATMTTPATDPRETNLLECAAAAPNPWYPKDYAQANGINRDSID